MCSAGGDAALPAPGFPIRASAGQRLFSASPRLIAVVHALLRLLVPRHPPCALNILTVIKSGRGDPHEAGRFAREETDARRRPLSVVSLALDLRFSRAAERREAGAPLSRGLSKLSSARLQLEATGQVRSTC